MESKIKRLDKLSIDPDYPARNRLLSPELGPKDIKISFDGGYCLTNSDMIVNDLSLGVLELGPPLVVPGCDIGAGMLAYVLQTSEMSMWVSPEALIRVVAKRLSSEEYFALRGRYGMFYEIEHAFYDDQTGRCLNPIDIDPSIAISQFELP